MSEDISDHGNNGTATPSINDTSVGAVTSLDSRAPSNPVAKIQKNEINNENNQQTNEIRKAQISKP